MTDQGGTISSPEESAGKRSKDEDSQELQRRIQEFLRELKEREKDLQPANR